MTLTSDLSTVQVISNQNLVAAVIPKIEESNTNHSLIVAYKNRTQTLYSLVTLTF